MDLIAGRQLDEILVDLKIDHMRCQKISKNRDEFFLKNLLNGEPTIGLTIVDCITSFGVI